MVGPLVLTQLHILMCKKSKETFAASQFIVLVIIIIVQIIIEAILDLLDVWEWIGCV